MRSIPWSVVFLLINLGANPAFAVPRLLVEAVDVRRLPDLALLFTVVDGSGDEVAGLRAEDFRLLLDGQAIEGLSVAPAARQTERAVAFVLENSSRLRGRDFFDLRNLAAELSDRLPPGARVALVLDSDSVSVPVELTEDRVRFKRLLAEVSLGGNGVALYSAVSRALSMLRDAPERLRSVVLLASGEEVLDGAQRDSVFTAARELRIPIHVFAAALRFESPELPALAEASGGRFYPEPLSANAADLARRELASGGGRYAAAIRLTDALDARPRHGVIEVVASVGSASGEFSFLMTPEPGISNDAINEYFRRSRARQSWWIVYFGSVAGGLALALLRDRLGVAATSARLLFLAIGLAGGAVLGFLVAQLGAI
jgi:von Willebrand factor type A domain-containing protein